MIENIMAIILFLIISFLLNFYCFYWDDIRVILDIAFDVTEPHIDGGGGDGEEVNEFFASSLFEGFFPLGQVAIVGVGKWRFFVALLVAVLEAVLVAATTVAAVAAVAVMSVVVFGGGCFSCTCFLVSFH